MDKATLAIWVKTHQAEVFRYLRYLGAWEVNIAEDLVQETFLAVFQSPNTPQTDDVRRQAAWLRGVARNIFLMHCRESRAQPVQYDSSTLEAAEQVWEGRFLRQGDGFDFLDSLHQCLDKLNPRQKEALQMRYWKKESRENMASTLGLSVDGVKSLLRRLRGALKTCVERALGISPAEQQ